MRGLWKKEFRGLLPFMLLILFTIMSSLVFDLLLEAPDQVDLLEWLSLNEPEDIYIEGLFLFVIAFTMASGLLVREHDEGTQEFLDSLPVSRTHNFLIKSAAALVILAIFPLATVVIGSILFAMTATSLDPPNQMGLILVLAVIEMGQLFVFLSVGLLLSFTRRFAWVLLPLLYFGYSYLHLRHPEMQYLNPFSLFDPIVSGNNMAFPYRHLGVQLLLGATCMVLAWAMYLQASDVMHRIQNKLADRTGGKVLLGVAGVAIVCLWSVVIYQTVFSDLDEEESTATTTDPWKHQDWETSQIKTADFTFTHKGFQADQARHLAAAADSLNHQVRDFLGAEPSPGPVMVDLTSWIPHLAGIAHWKKIQIDLGSCGGPDDRNAVLGHEMVHVCIAEMCDSYLGRHFSSTQFFHEGLASYLEYRLFRSPEELAGLRLVAAATYHRTGFRLEELINRQRLWMKLDKNLVYNMGEVFVHALVKTYGDEAPGQVLRAFGREEAPEDLSGESLWRDGLQAAGYSFDAVIGAFFVELDSLVVVNEQFLGELPRLYATSGLDEDGNFRVLFEGEPYWGTWLAVCRFRQNIRDDDFEFVEMDTGGAFIDSDYFLGNQAWYQMGWLDIENPDRAIYEEWQAVSIR